MGFFHDNGLPVGKVLRECVVERQGKGQIRVVMHESCKEAVVIRNLPILPEGVKIFLGTIDRLIVEQPNIQVHGAVTVQNGSRSRRGQWVKSQKLPDDGIYRYRRGNRHRRSAEVTGN